MKVIFEKDKAMNNDSMHYCPGCGHGLIQHMIGECLIELGVLEQAVGILGVGCSSPSWKYMDYDMISVPHGRPGAAASGMKRVAPQKIVYTYQGDGDSGSIGFAETLYAAIRGENITAFVINNTVYAMTGGQMAPTSLEGQVTITSVKGRDTKKSGEPLHLAELVAQTAGSKFVARTTLHDTANIRKTKRLIKTALENQVKGVGYSFIEILSPCPSIWHMPPIACMEHIENVIMKEFPIGILKGGNA